MPSKNPFSGSSSPFKGNFLWAIQSGFCGGDVSINHLFSPPFMLKLFCQFFLSIFFWGYLKSFGFFFKGWPPREEVLFFPFLGKTLMVFSKNKKPLSPENPFLVLFLCHGFNFMGHFSPKRGGHPYFFFLPITFGIF